jgi:hypothetical protein
MRLEAVPDIANHSADDATGDHASRRGDRLRR